MRQISKVVLLVAPVLLAACGCASKPAWISQKTETSPAEEVASERSERLLRVAKKYEADGKPEVAYQLYRHIVNQDPQSDQARKRMVALAPNKEVATAQLASRSKKKRSPQPDRASTTNSAKDQIAEIRWSQPDKKSALQEMTAKTDEKRVNSISLSYAGPDESTPASESDSIAVQETKTSFLTPSHSAQEKRIAAAVAKDSSTRVAQPISEFQLPETKSSVAEAAEPSATQAWWDAKFAAQEVEVSRPENSLTLAEMVEEVDALKDLQPKPEVAQLNSLESLVAEDHSDATIEATPEITLVSVQDLCKAGTPAELLQVVTLLDCPEPEVRIAGLIELGIKGADAAPTSPAVRALLNDQDAMVRAHAAGTVRDIEGNNIDSVEHLSSLLSEEDQGVVRLSCYLLGQMGADARPAVRQLKQIRNNSSGLTSLHAAEALTRIVPSETKSYGVLKNALTCDDGECRVFAAVSLGGVYEEAGEIAALALNEALGSRDANVRASAALSLGGLGKHAEIAVEQLQQISDSDTPEVRDAALTALACLGR